MRRDVTLLEPVTAVTEHTRTEGEAIATIVHMVNSGRCRSSGGKISEAIIQHG